MVINNHSTYEKLYVLSRMSKKAARTGFRGVFFFFVIVAAEKRSILLRLFSQLAVRLAERFLAENYPDLRSRTCAELFCALFSVNETF